MNVSAETPWSMQRVLRAAGRGLVLVAAYVIVGRVGRRLDAVSEQLRIFFPQHGIALAALVLFGLRYWPAVAAGAAINLALTRSALTLDFVRSAWAAGSLGRQLFTDDPAAYAIMPAIVAGNTLSTVFGAWMLRRVVRFDPSFSALEDTYRFLLYAVLLAPLVSAGFASLRFVAIEPSARSVWGEIFFRRWLGHAISNLVVAPALMTWHRLPTRVWTGTQIAELAALLAVLTWICVMIFTRGSVIGTLNYPMSYVPLLAVLWAALRFGPRGASTATLVIAAIAVYGSSQRAGPFMRDDNPVVNITLLQIYLMALAATGLLLGSASSERARTIRELTASREELRRLAGRLEAAREEERLRLARELHDELAQMLAGIRIGVLQLGKAWGSRQELQRRCQEVADLTSDAVETMRVLTRSLRPKALDELGLIEALRSLIAEFSQRYGIPVHFEPPGVELRLRPEQATALFRIAQEALTNVAKHAQARNVVLRLGATEGHYFLEIMDDGRGIDGSVLANSPGLGLVGMRERAMMLGGTFQVGPNRFVGHGTMVSVRIPVDEIGDMTHKL